MLKEMMKSFICSSLFALVIFFFQHSSSLATKKSYIIYLGTHSHGPQPTELDAEIATQSHYGILGSVLGSHEKALESMQYNYKKYINGFVAELNEDEVKKIRESSDVISVFENGRVELLTTRSWEFLGLEENDVTPNDSLWNKSRYGDGVIIGNMDTGVWPESESFNDKGLGPIPLKWKGKCMTGSDPTFKCNKKLIGARYFDIDIRSNKSRTSSSFTPRDVVGHGTHTLSTAGGSFVKGANVRGLGLGIAKGGSPYARVATYKVCWAFRACGIANILAAFEAAIGDGVDVLSLSIGAETTDFRENVMAIGSFHAVRNGISVVAAAGNLGVTPQSVANDAPWEFTVGASTSDRAFINKIFLGNSTLQFTGANAGPFRMLPRSYFYPLIIGVSASKNSSTTHNARYCLRDSLDPSKAIGKIVICEAGLSDGVEKGNIVQAAGGIGMIVIKESDGAFAAELGVHVLPASHLTYKDSQALLKYIKNTQNPTAYISDVETLLNIKPSPVVAGFSSRGPSNVYPQILKPDIIAPGVKVIAAVSGLDILSGSVNTTRKLKYDLFSGTSMSCPHVAGVVGLIKSMHPDWSPAAIRSALMTTATTFSNDNKTLVDYDGQQVTPFAYGAGHINPNGAADPGLIYNLTENDYLNFLCSMGSYTEKDLRLLTPTPHKCIHSKSILDFNYPSVTVNNFTTSATLTRRLTNVGRPGAYEVKVTAPSGVSVTVLPSNLIFNQTGEELAYDVVLKSNGENPKEFGYAFGSLTWTDGVHNVRSPLVVEII